jgi:hypothetical protein
MTPLLEKMTTASPDEVEDERGSSWSDPPQSIVGRFHGVRRILIAWREVDALTKLKLDAIIEASSGYIGAPAELLRREFAELPDGERGQATEFARWLGEYHMKEVQTSWDPQAIAEAFAGAN